MRLRWLLLGWTVLTLVAWLVAAGAWADQEAGCNPEYSFICFDESDIWLVTGAFMAAIWIFGALLLAIVVFVARTVRRKHRGREADAL